MHRALIVWIVTLIGLAAGGGTARAQQPPVTVTGNLVITAGAAHERWSGGTVVAGATNRTVSGNLQIRGGQLQGQSCTTSNDCFASDFCAGGVCCENACNGGGCNSCNLPGQAGLCRVVTAGTTCRASTGVCDAAETCNGSSATCPADGFSAPTVVCRGAAGTCDQTEYCTGTAASCPGDVYVVQGATCRGNNGGGCDVAETCSGTGPSCPADLGIPAGIVCRAATAECTQNAQCNGTGAACPANPAAPAGVECGTGVCDACNGSGTCTAGGTSCFVAQYMHTDFQGSIVATTNAGGAVVCTEQYDPWGNEIATAGECTDHKYTARELDEGTGLYDYGARMYDPALGRFLSVDTYPGTPDAPQTTNRYSYVLNNPFTYVDPTGHQSTKPRESEELPPHVKWFISVAQRADAAEKQTSDSEKGLGFLAVWANALTGDQLSDEAAVFVLGMGIPNGPAKAKAAGFLFRGEGRLPSLIKKAGGWDAFSSMTIHPGVAAQFAKENVEAGIGWVYTISTRHGEQLDTLFDGATKSWRKIVESIRRADVGPGGNELEVFSHGATPWSKVKGWRAVDGEGNFVGPFTPNPDFKP